MAAAEATAVNDASSLAAPLGNLLGYNQCSVPSSLDHPVLHMFNHSITQNAECPLSLSPFSHCFHSLQVWRKRQERRVHSYSHSTNIPSFFFFSFLTQNQYKTMKVPHGIQLCFQLLLSSFCVLEELVHPMVPTSISSC